MDLHTIVNEMPEGYRWATPEEVEQFAMRSGHEDILVQVRVGGTDEEPWTDIAIKDQR